MYKQSLELLVRRSGWFFREFNVVEVRYLSKGNSLFTGRKYLPVKLLDKINLFSSGSRNYAKNRDVKKEKKKKVNIDKNELQQYFDVEKLFSDIGKPTEYFKEELVRHATLRSSAGAIENIKISFEGNTHTIQDLARVGKKSPRLYVLDFSSFPAVIPVVIKTLQNSELNINAQQDGTKIFVPIPKVTKEYREVLVKKCKVYFNHCKDSIRNVQINYIKSLTKIDKLPVDEKFRITDQLTALGDQQILLAEEILKAKQEELLRDSVL